MDSLCVVLVSINRVKVCRNEKAHKRSWLCYEVSTTVVSLRWNKWAMKLTVENDWSKP